MTSSSDADGARVMPFTPGLFTPAADGIDNSSFDVQSSLVKGRDGRIVSFRPAGIRRKEPRVSSIFCQDAARSNDSISARVRGTSPPNSAISFSDSAMTFLALLR